MIGIFDSGIGGVTVLKEILKLLPNFNYIYYSDSINNPYGDKSKDELCKFSKNIVQLLIDKGCKIIVIACNTASAICKDYLRNSFNVPIIAIEPALKQAIDNNPKGNTLVMATKGTIESEKFLELYKKFDNKKVIIKSFPGLADLIEKNDVNGIKKYLEDNLQYKNIDNVILGCTHYPLIKREIIDVLGNVNFYDGSVGVSKKLKQIVQDINLKETKFKLEFIDSSEDTSKEKRFYDILRIGD